MSTETRKPPITRTPERDEIFYEALRSGLGPTKAAPQAGYSVPAVYTYRKQDPEFAARWEEAYEMGVQVQLAQLEDEADRRGREGVDEPVYYLGKVVGQVKKYSDALLMFRMKKLDPTYRDKVDVSHSGAVNNVMVVPGCTSVDEWEQQAQTQHEKTLGE